MFDEIDALYNQGIDLQQFAKQMLMYIDHHLLEDIDFFVKLSGAFGEIISTLRYYPYPAIAYKIALSKYLSE